MMPSFEISMLRNEHTLKIRLRGEFDDGSANQLIDTLKDNREDTAVAIIDTNDLIRLFSSGKTIFQKRITLLGDFCYRLVFTGKFANELIPAWTLSY